MSENGSVNFGLTEEQTMIQQLAREFSRSEIAPVAEKYDKNHEFPWPVIKKAQEIGLTTMAVPEKDSIVVIEGILHADKDFGAGYKYEVIIEDAEVK